MKRYSEENESDRLRLLVSFYQCVSAAALFTDVEEVHHFDSAPLYAALVDMEDVHHFDSVHNAVYFAVTVLSQQCRSVSRICN